jgi:hypothetical protein
MTSKNEFQNLFDTPKSKANSPESNMPESQFSKNDKRQVPFRMNVTAIKQLEYMAIDMDTTRQALLIEAVNDFFIKYKKPPIA